MARPQAPTQPPATVQPQAPTHPQTPAASSRTPQFDEFITLGPADAPEDSLLTAAAQHPFRSVAWDEADLENPYLKNISVFGGLDGSKQPQDFGINAQFGGRAAINWGIPLIESIGLGAQLGAAIDATADAVQVVQRTQGSSGRTQGYATVGLFQRTDSGFRWGAVYDFLSEDYYDSFSLGQWRIDLSYQLRPRTTIGVWSAISDHGDDGHYGATAVRLQPISQTNFYTNYIWGTGVQTMFWGGIASRHGQVNGVLGDQQAMDNCFVFGSQLFAPLSDRVAIFGQANFITPASSGTVDSYLGFAFYPYGGCRSVNSRFAPLQTVAAPTNFAVDLRRKSVAAEHPSQAVSAAGRRTSVEPA